MKQKDFEKEVELRFKRYKNLPQYKDWSDDRIKERARANLEKQLAKQKNEEELEKTEFDSDIFIDSKEFEFFEKLVKEYSDAYHFSGINDEQLLKELCWYEILLRRTKVATKKIGLTDVKTINELNSKIIEIKERLGIFKKTESNFLSFWEKLIKKFITYAQTHRGEYETQCPHCKKYTLWLLPIGKYEGFTFDVFRGTFIYNEHAYKCIDDNKLSFEDVAKFYGISKDYVEHLYKNIYLKDKALKKMREASDVDREKPNG